MVQHVLRAEGDPEVTSRTREGSLVIPGEVDDLTADQIREQLRRVAVN